MGALCRPMPPLNRDHLVYGEFTLQGGKLIFRTQGSMFVMMAGLLCFVVLHVSRSRAARDS